MNLDLKKRLIMAALIFVAIGAGHSNLAEGYTYASLYLLADVSYDIVRWRLRKKREKKTKLAASDMDKLAA